MANFDPQVQPMGDSPFVYGFGARPTRPPRADVSGETIGKSIGKGLSEIGQSVEQGAHLAYNVVSDDIKSQLHQQYDPLQNEFINRLAKVDDVLKKPGGQDLVDSATYPPEVQKLPGVVDQLIALRDNGKVSQTYLDMQRDSIAKQMRGKYQGMRDVIDGEFARMTREDPANKVISQLTDDINTQVGNARAARDKIGNMILKGVGDGNIPPAAYAQYQANPAKYGPILMNQIYQHAKVKSDLEIDDLKLRNAAAHHSLDKETASDNTDAKLGRSLGLFMSNLQVDIPALQGDNISQAVNLVNTDPSKYSDEDKLKLGQRVKAAQAAWINQVILDGNKPLNPDDPNSPTRASQMGGKAFQELVESKAKIFDSMYESLANAQFGSAHLIAEQAKVQMDDAGASILRNVPGLDAHLALMKTAGPYAGNLLDSLATDPNVAPNLKAYFSGLVTTMATQPHYQQDGTFTLGKALDDAEVKGLNTPKYASTNQAIADQIIKVVTNPQAPPQIKHNAASAIYSDPNTIAKVNDSTVNQQGQVTPGKSTLLSQTVNTQTTAAVKKLGDPDLTAKYIQYAKKSVGLVIGSEISTLNQVEDDSNVHLEWDSGRHQVSLRIGYEPGGSVSHTFGQIQQVQDSIKKINLALRSMVDVSTKLTHEDPDEFVAEFLFENGLQGKLMQAILAAHRKDTQDVRGDQ